MGVDVFFVLSGMLMSIILFDKRLSLRDFYIRRLSRIIPALFVFLFAVYGFAYLNSIEFSTIEFFSSLFFLRTYIPADPNIWATDVPVQHLWSLNVEEHAYSTCPDCFCASRVGGGDNNPGCFRISGDT